MRSTVEALSRDPALRAVGTDTVQLANRVYAGYDPYAYNYDAVQYPQAGIADFFFRKQSDERSAYLTPVPVSSQKGEVMLLLVSLLAFVGGGLYATRKIIA